MWEVSGTEYIRSTSIYLKGWNLLVQFFFFSLSPGSCLLGGGHLPHKHQARYQACTPYCGYIHMYSTPQKKRRQGFTRSEQNSPLLQKRWTLRHVTFCIFFSLAVLYVHTCS